MKYLFLSFLIITLAIFVFSPFIAKADDFCKPGDDFYKSGIVPCGRNCDNLETTTVDETKPCTLCHFIIGFWNLINYGFKILVFLAFVCLVIAGIMYITSAGSEKMMETAKTFIKQILFGFAIVLLGWVFIFTVMNYFAVKQPDLGIGKTEGWTKFTCSTESTGAYQGSFGDNNTNNNPSACPHECCDLNQGFALKSCTDPIKKFCVNFQCVSCLPAGTYSSNPAWCCSCAVDSITHPYCTTGSSCSANFCRDDAHCRQTKPNGWCDATYKCQDCYPTVPEKICQRNEQCCSGKCEARGGFVGGLQKICKN